MRALITGAAGFVGQWLCRELLDAGYDVWGARLGDALPPGALDETHRDAVRWIGCDVRRAEEIRAALDASTPDAIFHLAGVAYLPAASADPGAALDVNVGAAARLLGDVRERRAKGELDSVVVIVGSGEQYGAHDAAELPLRESAEQRPASVYAASKAAQEVVALEAFRAAGVRVIATRPFNHSGAGQSPSFLLPALVRRALVLRASKGDALILGNTASVRDYLHVGDVARAYRLLAERGKPGEAYNIASGTGTDVATVAARVLALVGIDARLQSDPSLVRPVDVPALVGDAGKLRAATGWAPRHTLDTIIDDLIRATSR